MSTSTGVKFDSGKPDPTYLSWNFISGIAEVREFGSRKYGRNNWLRGIGVTRNCAAALRHIFQFLWVSSNDPETGKCHLLHAACSLEQAYNDLLQHPHLDDRLKGVKERKERAYDKNEDFGPSDCGAV